MNQYISWKAIYFIQRTKNINKKINGYDCHHCDGLSLIGGEKGITLLSVGILKNSDLWSLYKQLINIFSEKQYYK